MGPATASPRPPAPASPTCASAWRALLRFLLWTVGLSLAFSLLAVPFVELPWWRVARRCVSIAAALSLWICVWTHERRTLAPYGLSAWITAGKAELMTGLGLGGALLAALLAAGLALGYWEIAVTPDRAKLWRVALTFIPAALVIGVLEEAVFRGYLLQHLQACGVRFAVAASSAVYAAVHLKSLAVSQAGMRELTGLFLFGVILCVSYLRTGRLWLAIGLHAVLAYGARVNKLVLARTPDLDPWLIGTNRLLDGALGWAVLGVLLVLVVFVTRSQSRGGADAG